MTDKPSIEIPESWENEPAFLSKVQRADPMGSIRFIANWEPLYEMRFRLQDLYMAAMYSSHWKDDSPKRKGEWMWFFEEIMDLLELAYLIDEMVRAKKLTYSYTDATADK